MKIGSLFAGIGGFDLGFERQGFECAWQCEIDKYANQVLENHWPEVKRYNDIRQLTKPEYVDVVCGGFPCQDLSVAGNRTGLSGHRSGLFFELARVIDEVRPKWFVLENVPGLLSSKGGEDMQTVLETLVECGYHVAYRVLDSQNFGVAQRRKRVFIVGSLGNPGCVKVLFEPESISIHTKKSKQTENKAPTTTGNLTTRDFKGIGTTVDDKIVLQDQGGSVMSISNGIVGTLRREEHGHNAIVLDPRTQGEPRFYTDEVPTLNTNQSGQRQPCVIKTANTKAKGNNISTKGVSYTLAGSVNQAVTQDKITRLTPMKWQRTEKGKAIRRENQRNGRDYTPFNDGCRELVQSGETVTGTLMTTAIAKDSLVGNQSMIRRLTPTEYERLQGFPDGWTSILTDTQRYKTLGNAVTVSVIEWIAKRIKDVERKTHVF